MVAEHWIRVFRSQKEMCDTLFVVIIIETRPVISIKSSFEAIESSINNSRIEIVCGNCHNLYPLSDGGDHGGGDGGEGNGY